MQMQIFEAERRNGSRKVSADRRTAVRKDPRAVGQLPACDLEGVVTGRAQERYCLVIAQPVLRVLAIANDYGLRLCVEVLPLQTTHLADAHGAREAEPQDVRHWHGARKFLKVGEKLLELGIADAALALLRLSHKLDLLQGAARVDDALLRWVALVAVG